MDPSQFALTIIVVAILLLAFALDLAALTLSNGTTQSNILKLFNEFLKRLPSFFENKRSTQYAIPA